MISTLKTERRLLAFLCGVNNERSCGGFWIDDVFVVRM